MPVFPNALHRCVLAVWILFLGGCVPEHVQGNGAADSTSLKSCDICPEMVAISPGEFVMGALLPGDKQDDFDGPAHQVTIVQAFEVARYEVTVGEFRAFVDDTGRQSSGCHIYHDNAEWFFEPAASWQNPGFPQNENHPVVCVSHLDAAAYVDWLNRKSGLDYRLLSEAEWEFLAAASDIQDTRTLFEIANVGGDACCAPAKRGADQWLHTAPVGSFPADKNGLFDIRGNVWEWQQDCFHKNYFGAPHDGTAWTWACDDQIRFMVRGGSWGDGGELLEKTYRLRAPQDKAYFTLGFRLARSID